MAKYKAVFDNSQAVVFGSLAGNTDSFDSRLRAIANAMDARDGSMAALRNQIRTTAGKLPPIAMRLRREGDAWRQSVEIYRAAEQSAKSFVGAPVKICVEAERPKNIVELIVWWIRSILEDIKKRSLGSGAVTIKKEPKKPWWWEIIIGAAGGSTGGGSSPDSNPPKNEPANSITVNGITVTADPNSRNCASLISRFYKEVYGVSVSNLFATKNNDPYGVVKTESPKIGDIVKMDGHWALVKSVNGDGTYTIIEENFDVHLDGHPTSNTRTIKKEKILAFYTKP